MKNIIGIYEISSISNPEKIYIGSSISITKRWKTHINALRANRHCNLKLQNHFNKYGEDDLSFRIVMKCSKSELINNEQRFIDKHNPLGV